MSNNSADEIKREIEELKNRKNKVENEKKKISDLGIDEEVDYSTLELRNEFEGSKTLDFDISLTGKDILVVKSKYERERKKKAKWMAELDDLYFLMMAERMTGIEFQKFLELPAQDYTRVRNHVAGFLGEE
ncbi:hypothetical protein [Cetobacterium sp.]|uniref:hypothetical protein n=1 Tax=Cetobacterium sp. TaxID=2071632 RepID=UPI003F3CDEA0